MGQYFKITNKQKKNRRIFVEAPPRSQVLFAEIEEIVGMLPNPSNDIPHALEVDGWGELACEGDTYEAEEFDVECISQTEYNEWQVGQYSI